MADRIFQILNLGAGVQSTALYLMSLRRDEPEHVPVFDFAIFADTQEEPREVYDHLAWLKGLGGPPILERTAGKLGDDLMAGRNSTVGRFASIPAFTMSPGAPREGQIRRQCTSEYKVEVVERAIRRDILGLKPRCHIPKDVRVTQYFGLSYDEPRRVIRVKQRHQALPWTTPRFPLFDMEMTRRDCVDYLLDVAKGRHVPRSACVFCPYKSDEEWRRLRDDDPSGWSRAVEVDEAIRMPGNVVNRNVEASIFLHRSCVPLKVAAIDAPVDRHGQHLFGFAQECQGMCGV